MFSFFRKRNKGTKVIDVVWMSQLQKLNALAKIVQDNTDTLLICWFPETADVIADFLSSQNILTNNVVLATQVSKPLAEHRNILFAEHYPLQEKEELVFAKVGLESATVYTALDEPLMKKFGSEKTVSLMKTLGIKENESIQHAMITASIRNAQNKLKEKMQVEHSARSQTEWIRMNASNSEKL